MKMNEVIRVKKSKLFSLIKGHCSHICRVNINLYECYIFQIINLYA